MKTTEQLWRYADAARFLGLPVPSLRVLVHYRKVPHVRLGPRTVLFDPAKLRAWLAEREVAAVESAAGAGAKR